MASGSGDKYMRITEHRANTEWCETAQDSQRITACQSVESVIENTAEMPHRVTFQEDITDNPMMTQDVTTNGDPVTTANVSPRQPTRYLRISGRTIRKPSRYIDE